MVTWQLTATTIYCEVVADEVTFLVYKDGSVKCTGEGKHGPAKGRVKGRPVRTGQAGSCTGRDCARPGEYRDRLLAEEAAKSGKKAAGGGAA